MSPASSPDLKSRCRGALIGLAAGDAIGAAVEFRAPGTFEPVTEMTGGGQFRLAPGQWTDDTSLALCLAESLIACGGFDPLDQLERYVRWYRQGYNSSTGECFDIGYTTREALHAYERTRQPWCGPTDPNKAGNGSLMRVAPVALFFADDPEEAMDRAADSSRTTHGAPTAIAACRYYAGLIVGALQGATKEDLLQPHYSPVPGYWAKHPLPIDIAAVVDGTFKRRNPPMIRGTGFVVQSLEASLWAFHHGTDFRDALLRAVNLGEDADTTGAICGQLAGAFYGEDGIPPEWRAVAFREQIEEYADALAEAVQLRAPER